LGNNQVCAADTTISSSVDGIFQPLVDIGGGIAGSLFTYVSCVRVSRNTLII
jgi:hypothetical protein